MTSAPTPPIAARQQGVVVAYDDHAGFGELEAGGTRYWFHCTALLDGSRHATPGQQVGFRPFPGHRGRWEAAEVG